MAVSYSFLQFGRANLGYLEELSRTFIVISNFSTYFGTLQYINYKESVIIAKLHYQPSSFSAEISVINFNPLSQ